MPRHEITLITKILQRKESADVLKSVVSHMLGNGFVVRKVESLGDRCLPFKMANNETGSYFVLDGDFPRDAVPDLKQFFGIQNQIIRSTIFEHKKVYSDETLSCCGMEQVDYETELKEISKPKPKEYYSNRLNEDIIPFPI